ncbi:hypothetical protein [Micromonospora sp. NBC_00421]|uniref:hypothetical protein n=1 Tax=Micromonospora sp. NBC_00421 TaxID=2975976 RepID=UPI002E1B5011
MATIDIADVKAGFRVHSSQSALSQVVDTFEEAVGVLQAWTDSGATAEVPWVITPIWRVVGLEGNPT